ncbi:GGDEF domain-containing protein [Kosmotoga pacifica]|uniref:GGDEF domain-containing protein n=1 Tax=Kosmotoga pacifica TaxID=1330330 RepID=A0A0G2Z4Z0_9BACT|nr:GGDEF domain-containing protein [Kosmotoga pacifica]AKI96680.1 hypothetical protein IX53_01310 [Kosmotoga pacifica]
MFSEEFEIRVRKAHLPPMVIYLSENLNIKFDVSLKVHRDPSQVPYAVFQLVKALRKMKIPIQSVRYVDDPRDQSAFIKVEKGTQLSYELLKRSVEDIIYHLLSTDKGKEVLFPLFYEAANLSNALSNLNALLSEATRSLDWGKITYAVFTGLTAGYCGSFNRAFFLHYVPKEEKFEITSAFGPADNEEAHRVWEEIELLDMGLSDFFANYNQKAFESRLEKRVKGIEITFSEFEGTSLQEIVEKKKMYHIQSVEELPETLRNKLGFSGEMLAVPVFTSMRFFGIFLLDNYFDKKPISRLQKKVAEIFSKQYSVLWESHILFSKTKELAEKDSITGLYNRHELNKFINDQTSFDTDICSLVFIDVDRFKAVNDKHGHSEGDRVLKKIGDIILSETRTGVDRAFRYGGDEFVILLPLEKNAARNVIERIKKRIETTTPVSISYGIASFPDDSKDFHELLKLADKRTYLMKREKSE